MDTGKCKVPHVGWSKIWKEKKSEEIKNDTPFLNGVENGSYMYFVHSFYVEPLDREIETTTSVYGNFEFCSSFSKENVFATQFHPERSGDNGVKIYENLFKKLSKRF